MLDSLIEVQLQDADDFKKIVETLTRIGVASRRDSTLYQSCHILHKRGKYYIVHFKEMFGLDGRPVNISEEDIQRRNRIATLLEEWGLLTIVDSSDIKDDLLPLNKVKILPYREKQNWNLVAKYTIGKK